MNLATMVETATRFDFLKCTFADIPPAGEPEPWAGWKVRAYNGILPTPIYEDNPGEEFEEQLEGVLEDLKERSWVVARWERNFRIRAWRGDRLPVHRADFRLTPRGWRVRKWLAGWRATTDPVSDEVKRDLDIYKVQRWMDERAAKSYDGYDGWRYQWVGRRFMRAWYGPRKPVRNAGQVLKMRLEAEAYSASRVHIGTPDEYLVKPRPDWWPLDVSTETVLNTDLAYLL